MDVIIVSPNLDPSVVLGGVASVSRFIVENNKACKYIHFELGRRHAESGGFGRAYHLWNTFKLWRQTLKSHPNAIVHYNFPLSPEAIIRDFFFMREARKQKRKMIVHIHGGLYMNTSHIPFALHSILKMIFHWDVPFVVLSEHEKEVLSSRFSPKTVYISSESPDFLFIALPSPRKEVFILKYKKLLNVGVFYGVGGALDAKAGILKRPPKWFREYGIEWGLRLLRKPNVYGRRVPLTIKFLKLAIS